MQLHDVITDMAVSMGTTFDEMYLYTLFALFGFLGGTMFMFDFAFDVGHFLYHGIRRLFWAIMRIIRRFLRVHFQK